MHELGRSEAARRRLKSLGSLSGNSPSSEFSSLNDRLQNARNSRRERGSGIALETGLPDHRDWTQRGGYGGFYIPRVSFRLYFGKQHFFRIHSRPVDL